MVEAWTGNIVGMLHVHGITRMELADELGVTPEYVSMVLNGKRSVPAMEKRMTAAIDAIVERRSK